MTYMVHVKRMLQFSQSLSTNRKHESSIQLSPALDATRTKPLLQNSRHENQRCSFPLLFLYTPSSKKDKQLLEGTSFRISCIRMKGTTELAAEDSS